MSGGRYLYDVPRLRVPGVGLVNLIIYRHWHGGLELCAFLPDSVAGDFARRTFYGYTLRQARSLFAAYLSDVAAGGAA